MKDGDTATVHLSGLHRKLERPTWPRSVAIDRTAVVIDGNKEPAEGFWDKRCKEKSLGMLVLKLGPRCQLKSDDGCLCALVFYWWFFFSSLAISFMYDTLDEESGVLAQCYDDFALTFRLSFMLKLRLGGIIGLKGSRCALCAGRACSMR